MKRLQHKAEVCGDRAMQTLARFNMGKSRYEQDNKEVGLRLMEQEASIMAGTDYSNKYENCAITTFIPELSVERVS